MLLGGSESDIEVLPLGSRTPARSVSVACLLTRSGEAKRRPRGWGTTEEAEAKQDGGERGGRGDKGRFAASEVAKSFCAREAPSLYSSKSFLVGQPGAFPSCRPSVIMQTTASGYSAPSRRPMATRSPSTLRCGAILHVSS